MRVVEFLLSRLNVYVGVRQLAEIDFRARYVKTFHRALDGHIAQNQLWQSFRREPIHRVHRDPVAMRVDELLVDPVAAALREFVDAKFARGEHHLADRAIDFIAINVDIGKVVVSANLLHLAQPDILESRLIIRRVGRLDRRFGGELSLHDPVQSIGPARQVDVVGDKGLLTNQFVRLDDKAADVPAQSLKREETYRGRRDRDDKPAYAGCRHGVVGYDHGAENERHTDREQAGKGNVRVRVGHAGENCVIGEQLLEAIDVDAHREDQQQERKPDGDPAQGQADAALSGKHTRAAGDEDKERRDRADHHRQHHQPAGDELPRGKGQQIEVQRPAEDRVHHAAHGVRRIPIERERRPLRHHAGAGCGGDDQREAKSDGVKKGLHRQSNRLPADEDRVTARQVPKVRPLQSQERSI